MKIHPLLLAAILATGGVASAQTTPATPAVTPAPTKSAAPAAEHKAAMHKMSMHRHTHKTVAASPTAPDQMTTRDERMAAAEADYQANVEKKSDQPAAHHWMHHHHAGHAMHKHQPAKAAPAA